MKKVSYVYEQTQSLATLAIGGAHFPSRLPINQKHTCFNLLYLRLYSHPICPFAERARLALLAREIEFQTINVDFPGKPDWFKELGGTTPTLETTTGDFITESDVLVQLALDLSDKGIEVLPKDPFEAAKVRKYTKIRDANFLPSTMKGLISGDEKDIEFTIKRMREIENDLSQNDRSNSYLLNRDEIGFADIILSPILIRNIFPMQENCNNCKELKLKDYPHIAKYVDTILEHPKIGEGFTPKWGFINFLMNKRKDPSISLPYPFDETTFEESQSNKEIIIKDGLTAKPLLNSNYIRLYGHPLCPYVQRAILVLAAKKVNYQFVGIDLTAKNDWHCQINGGFVPILETPDGVIVTESLQI